MELKYIIVVKEVPIKLQLILDQLILGLEIKVRLLDHLFGKIAGLYI